MPELAEPLSQGVQQDRPSESLRTYPWDLTCHPSALASVLAALGTLSSRRHLTQVNEKKRDERLTGCGYWGWRIFFQRSLTEHFGKDGKCDNHHAHHENHGISHEHAHNGHLRPCLKILKLEMWLKVERIGNCLLGGTRVLVFKTLDLPLWI